LIFRLKRRAAKIADFDYSTLEQLFHYKGETKPIDMKTAQWIFTCGLIVFATAWGNAQTPQTSGADTSGNKSSQNTSDTGSQKISDTSFLTRGIRQQILDIRLAQVATDRANSPRVKQAAREIIKDGRENLQKMLALTQGKNLHGLTQQEIDAAMGKLKNDGTMTTSDPAASATSGNTVTDSLGSGSSGSGNVGAQDTGTLARTTTVKRNSSYSEQGDYAYNNNLFMHEAEILNSAKGREFDTRWLSLMYRIHQGKVDYYNRAMAQVQDTRLKMAITQALPKIRLHNSTLMRLVQGRDASEGHQNLKQGEGNEGAGRR
jgi:uncharacterized protein (DUF305 family)